MKLVFCLFVALTLGLMMDVGQSNAQMIVAHRGASHDAPENTLAAFELAWQQDADAIEGDYYLTADGQIVCIHDPDTERVAGTKLIVQESTLAELRKLDVGLWKDRKFKGEVPPTLSEVIQTVPAGKTLVIELKSTTAIVPVLAKQLAALDLRRIGLLIIAFDRDTVAACRKQIPEVRVHWLTNFKKNPTAKQIAETVKETGAHGVGLQSKPDIIDARFVEELNFNGCPEFHVWTVDSVEDAKRFQALGAVGITTNVPGIMVTELRE